MAKSLRWASPDFNKLNFEWKKSSWGEYLENQESESVGVFRFSLFNDGKFKKDLAFLTMESSKKSWEGEHRESRGSSAFLLVKSQRITTVYIFGQIQGNVIVLLCPALKIFTRHGCSNHSNLEMEAEFLTKTLSYLNLNISRTKNGINKL